VVKIGNSVLTNITGTITGWSPPLVNIATNTSITYDGDFHYYNWSRPAASTSTKVIVKGYQALDVIGFSDPLSGYFPVNTTNQMSLGFSYHIIKIVFEFYDNSNVLTKTVTLNKFGSNN